MLFLWVPNKHHEMRRRRINSLSVGYLVGSVGLLFNNELVLSVVKLQVNDLTTALGLTSNAFSSLELCGCDFSKVPMVLLSFSFPALVSDTSITTVSLFVIC